MPNKTPQRLTDNTTVRYEREGDGAAIERLLDVCFGPDRFKKTAYRFREGVAPVKGLSFVVEDNASHETLRAATADPSADADEAQRRLSKPIVGTIRYWPVILPDGSTSLLLGPIAVEPARQSEGIGVELMNYSIGIAKDMHYASIILVGDAPYYNRFGFVRENTLGITLPGWVDESRFLGLEIIPGALRMQKGMLGKWPT